jgi:prepilin-type N-terminal cleavage/methylation domain-containing protein
MLHRIREAKKNESGFTLIELLIVIVILGILAAIVVFAVGGITDRGKVSACKADVKTVEVGAEAAFAQTGSYPASMAAMVPQWLHEVPSATNYTVTYTVNVGPPQSVTVAGSIC